MAKYQQLLTQIHACTICEAHLEYGCRPVLQFHPKAKILIAGQAPGRKVHESGIPFDDASGIRLRDWMGINREIFYDPEKIAILPMGFCYPGTGKTGDLPPRPECLIAWHSLLMQQLQKIQFTIVLGKYAQAYHFKDNKLPLTDLVKSWKKYWPDKIPLPHPSPRNNIWLKKNPWFEKEVLPEFKNRVTTILQS